MKKIAKYVDVWRFIKIYGADRTGTNFTSWMLSHNFNEVIVLQNMLGSKHGAPNKPFDYLLEEWRKKNGDIYRNDKHGGLQCHPWNIHVNVIKKAIAKKKLKFVITFREPYNWVARFSWYYSKPRPEKITDNMDRVEQAVKKRFNPIYSQCLDNLKDEDTIFLKLDYFTKNQVIILDRIQQKFNLTRANYISPLKRFGAGFDHKLRMAKESVEQMKKMKVFKTELSKRCIEYVDKNLDWNVYRQMEQKFTNFLTGGGEK